MSRVNIDKKLELVRTIRMQNQYNRMKCRERESLLYGIAPPEHKGELYSAEAAAGIIQGELQPPVKGGFLTGFRIRFVIALILFSVFIYLDRNNISLLGKNTFDLFISLTESIELPILNFIDL